MRNGTTGCTGEGTTGCTGKVPQGTCLSEWYHGVHVCQEWYPVYMFVVCTQWEVPGVCTQGEVPGVYTGAWTGATGAWTGVMGTGVRGMGTGVGAWVLVSGTCTGACDPGTCTGNRGTLGIWDIQES